ncbi:MAG TPA: hypothetical protein VHT02_10725 [Methylocella sp.]|jgi:hypothetical protein|nr:hypothetical protein [Methylocella sp.]
MCERVLRKGADFFAVGRGNAKMAKLAVQLIETAFTASRDGGDARSAAFYERHFAKARALAQKLAKR